MIIDTKKKKFASLRNCSNKFFGRKFKRLYFIFIIKKIEILKIKKLQNF
jgi:hypothetical protein